LRHLCLDYIKKRKLHSIADLQHNAYEYNSMNPVKIKNHE
jgi:hypothetical protein